MSDLLIYKFLTEDMASPMGSGRWRVNRWRSVRGELVPCQNGLHAAGVDNLAPFVNSQLWRVEIGGEHVWHADTSFGRKVVARRMRLVERVEAWNDHTMRAWAADCADRVLHVFERRHVNDTRPREAIATARRFLAGEASREQLDAAGAAAAAAVMAAAADAAAAANAAWAAAAAEAAWGAAEAAAARSAAWAADAVTWATEAAWAARAEERRWQSRQLAELVGLPRPAESEVTL